MQSHYEMCRYESGGMVAVYTGSKPMNEEMNAKNGRDTAADPKLEVSRSQCEEGVEIKGHDRLVT